ncbi:Highly reducing polyketide synthase cla2, partial [Colletotrichum shisoi]
MDPMQRLGLEIAYEAFENAGIPMQKLVKSTTAVYSGAMTNDYQMLAEADPYRLGALVTGHNLIVNPTMFSQLSAMHMVSPEGISHSFDAAANGYGRGEGIAGLVLKRLSLALADGDVIRAVIRATGVNSDGKTPGITVPSEDAQAKLIRRVYEGADLDMARTAYFEGPDRGLIKTVLCLESGVIPPVAGLRETNPELLEDGSNLIFPTAAVSWPATGLRRASINSFGLSALAHILVARRTAHAFRGFVVATTREDLVSKLLSDDGHPTPLPVLRSSENRRLVFLFTGQGAQRPGMAKELLITDSVFRDSITRSQKHLQRLGCEWDLSNLLVQACAETLNDAKYSQPACTAVQIALIDLLRHWGVVPSAVIGHSSGELAAAFAAGAISHEDAIRVAYYRGFLATQVSSLVGRPGAMLAVGLPEIDASRFLRENGLDAEITIACVNSPSSVTLSGPSTAISLAEEALRKAQTFVRLLRTGGVAYHSPDMNVVGDEFLRRLGPLQPSRDRCLQVPMYSSVTELRIEDARTLTSAYWHLNMTSPVRFAGALYNLLSSRDLDTQGCSLDMQHCTVLEIGPAKTLAGPVVQIMTNIDGSQKSESVPNLSMLSANEDSRLSTLTAAGMLWSIGVSIDLNKVNDLGCFVHKSQLPELSILPPYAWNHDKSYWHDAMPALVGLRGDKAPRIDLLGTPVLPRNPFGPAWHNVQRIKELPLLVDHVVDGAALFPAAGYLAMAIEAVRGLARDKKQLFYGIELLDVMFENSLMVSKDTEDENQKGQAVALTLRPDTHDDWVFEFAVYSVSTVPEQWRRLAKGTVVGLVADKSDGDEPADFEQQERERQWQSEKRPHLHNIKMAADKHVDTKAFYAHLASIGLEYGPTFRGLNAIRCTTDTEPQGHGKAFGECIVPDSRSAMPESYEHDYLIHPATLDSLFQLVFAALQSDPYGEMTLASIPISVRRVFIASTVPRSSGARLVGMASSKRLANKISDSGHADTSSSDLTFCDAGFERPAVLVEEIVLRQILSPTALTLADGEGVEDSSFHRTGEMRPVISLVEFGSPFVYNWSKNDLEHFRMLICSASLLLWLTTADFQSPSSETTLRYAPTVGLLRAIRAEFPDLKLPLLDISSATSQDRPGQVIDTILYVLQHNLVYTARENLAEAGGSLHNQISPESEYSEVDGRLFIPRVLAHAESDRYIATETPLRRQTHLFPTMVGKMHEIVASSQENPQLWVKARNGTKNAYWVLRGHEDSQPKWSNLSDTSSVRDTASIRLQYAATHTPDEAKASDTSPFMAVVAQQTVGVVEGLAGDRNADIFGTVANYCAGNTFEDALVHYRRANGFPATSLNIGLVLDSSHFGRGTMSSYSNVDEYLAMFGHLAPVTVTTEEMFASVKMVLTMSRSRSNSGQPTSCDIPTQLI